MIGQIIGTFRIEQKIGEGGMGAVFRGHDLMLEREVAIKALRPELARQPELVARFRSEAVTLAKLNHSHIATLYNFLRHGDDYFMAMEFVRGQTLDQVIRQSGAMEVERAVRLFCQALEGITHAHALGVIHRDIKSANLMLTANDQVKVMDFGIARVLGTARQTKTGRLIGTLEYMSPEQMRGAETDARSDIYSLGILLYEMLTGRVPFQADSDYELMRAQVENDPLPPREFKADIPRAVEAAILQSLTKDPAGRFPSAAEFRSTLLAAVPAAALQLEPTMQAEPVLKATRVAANASDVDWQSFAASPAQELPRRRDSGFDSTTGTFTLQLPSFLLRARQSLEAKVGPLNWKHYGSAATALFVFVFALSALRSDSPSSSPSISPVPSRVVVLPPSVPAPTQPQPAALPTDNAPAVEVKAASSATPTVVAEEKAAPRVKAAPVVRTKATPPPQVVSNNPAPMPAKPTPAPMEVRPTPTPQKPGKVDKTLDTISKGAETAGKVGGALGKIIGIGKRKQ